MKPFKTLPAMVRYVLNTYRNARAFNYRRDGEWHSVSTEQFFEMVRRVSLGLRVLGVRQGDKVGLLSSSSPFWLIADLGIQIAGGVTVPMFDRISIENFEFQVADSRIKHLFIFGQPQWDTYKKGNVSVEKVIVNDGVEGSGDEVLSLEALMDLGDGLSEKDPGLFAQLRDQVTEDSLATIIYTSGSTGVPKGVELTQGNFVSQLHGMQIRYPLDAKKDVALSCLPLAHVFERTVMYYYVSFGVSVFFVDDVFRVGDFFREIKPTICAVVPRILEKIYSKVEAGLQKAGYARQKIGTWALELAHNNQGGLIGTAEHIIADKLVYGKIREALGGRVEAIISGGAALDAGLCNFFLQVGIPVYQGYGLTETSPIISSNFIGCNKAGTVGPPLPGIEVKIGENDEICCRGSNVMRGYYGRPDLTDEVIDQEGWFHTGDCGKFDEDGFLVVTGRIKEILKTSNGKMIAPVPIELALVRHSLVEAAMVVADGYPYTTCLLFPAFDNLAAEKVKAGAQDASNEDLLDSSHVREQIDALIMQVNGDLNHWEHIQRYRWVATPLTIEGGDLTPTLKVRRSSVTEKYKSLISEMYQEGAQKV
jgi:long-chain acyl-CoA synthetase